MGAESQMSNTNVMDNNNKKLWDSIWKYAFKLSKITIIIMNLDVFMPKSICVYCYNVQFNTTWFLFTLLTDDILEDIFIYIPIPIQLNFDITLIIMFCEL